MQKLLVSVLFVILLFGCHPARMVASQDADVAVLKSKWINEYVSANPCPQLPEINLDSLCEGLGYSAADLFTVTPEENKKPVDTSVKDSGKAPYNHKPCRPNNILVPGPPDMRMIKLLNDSLAAVRQQLAFCNGKNTGAKEVYLKQSRWKWNIWGWMFAGMCSLLVLLILFLLNRKTR